jgi:hypothetical protein
MDDWEDPIRLVAAVLGSYWAILWLSAVVWTYRDVRERSTDIVSQGVAVVLVLVFNIPGLILYLILRPHETLVEAYERNLEAEAILHEMGDLLACPSCHKRVEADFLFCPHCRIRLRESCLKCSKPLSLSWVACPYCGTERPVAPPRTTFSQEAAAQAAPSPLPATPSPATPTSSGSPSPSTKTRAPRKATEESPSGASAKTEPSP